MTIASKPVSCTLVLCLAVLMAGECMAADVYQLPLADCATNCGTITTDVDDWCDDNCCWASWSGDPDPGDGDHCQLTVAAHSFTPGSKQWVAGSDKTAIADQCLSAPGSGPGTSTISTASSVSETATSSYNWSFGTSGKIGVNLSLIASTEIGYSASFGGGTSNSTSKAQTDSRSCEQTIPPCIKKLSIRSMFGRTHNGTATGTLVGRGRCDGGSACPEYDWTCWSTGTRYSNWFDFLYSTNPCTQTLTLQATQEVVDGDCTFCSIPCLTLHQDCCEHETGTQAEVDAAVAACETTAHTWP